MGTHRCARITPRRPLCLRPPGAAWSPEQFGVGPGAHGGRGLRHVCVWAHPQGVCETRAETMAFWGAHRAGSPSNHVPAGGQAGGGACAGLPSAWSSSLGALLPLTDRGPGVSDPRVAASRAVSWPCREPPRTAGLVPAPPCTWSERRAYRPGPTSEGWRSLASREALWGLCVLCLFTEPPVGSGQLTPTRGCPRHREMAPHLKSPRGS